MSSIRKAFHGEITIRPRNGLDISVLREVYSFRELLYSLVLRDIKVRYKQTVLGVAWVLFKPLFTMAVFTFIFGRLAKFPSDGVPYPVFVMTGLIPWNYFSGALSASSYSMLTERHLISKIYFPRIISPLAASVSHAIDVFISFLLLLVLMGMYGVFPSTGIVFVPLLFLAAFVAAIGPGLLFSALMVRYRDVGQIVPFLTQVWMYATPVIYPVAFIPEKYRWLLYLNPVCGVVEGFRACLLPGKSVDMAAIGASVLVSTVMFIVGFYYYIRVERSFADVI